MTFHRRATDTKLLILLGSVKENSTTSSFLSFIIFFQSSAFVFPPSISSELFSLCSSLALSLYLCLHPFSLSHSLLRFCLYSLYASRAVKAVGHFQINRMRVIELPVEHIVCFTLSSCCVSFALSFSFSLLTFSCRYPLPFSQYTSLLSLSLFSFFLFFTKQSIYYINVCIYIAPPPYICIYILHRRPFCLTMKQTSKQDGARIVRTDSSRGLAPAVRHLCPPASVRSHVFSSFFPYENVEK